MKFSGASRATGAPFGAPRAESLVAARAAAGGTDRPRTTPARSPARRASGSAAPRSCPAARARARAPASGRTRRQLLGGDAEMAHDRAHDQRRDRELDQCLHEIRGPSRTRRAQADRPMGPSRTSRAQPGTLGQSRYQGVIRESPARCRAGPAAAAAAAAGPASPASVGAASRLSRLRTASSSGAAAPERRISIWMSGQNSGSSQVPITTNGSWNGVDGAAGEQARGALEVEIARRDRGGARDADPHRRRLDPHVLGVGGAVGDLQVHRQLVIGRAAAAEVAAADRQRIALEPLERLLDIEPRDRALAARQRRPMPFSALVRS